MLQGRVASVMTKTMGSTLDEDHLLGETTLLVADAGDFTEEGGELLIEESTYSYTVLSFGESPEEEGEVSQLGITPGLVEDVEAGTTVAILPASNEKVALVLVSEEVDDAIQARIPHGMKDRFPDGVREIEQQESVSVAQDDDGYYIIDVMGETLQIEAEYITGLPDPFVPTEAPEFSPNLIVTGLPTGLMARTEAIEPSTQLEYHISTEPGFTPDSTTLSVITRSTLYVVTVMPDETSLQPDVIYYMKVVATNSIGSAPPSPEASADLDLDMIMSLAVAEIAAGFILAGSIQVGQMTIDANTGITIPQPDGGVIHFPVNGIDPATITAHIVARSLNVQDNTIISGQGSINGHITLDDVVLDPTEWPTIVQVWDTVQASKFVGPVNHGAVQDFNDVEGRMLSMTKVGSASRIEKWDKYTGADLGNIATRPWTNSLSSYGIVQDGTYYYVLAHDAGRGKWFIYKIVPYEILTNLVTNPSFETGVHGWTVGSAGGFLEQVDFWGLNEGYSPQGTFACRSIKFGGGTIRATTSSHYPVTAGQTYRFSAWLHGEHSSQTQPVGTMRIYWYDASNNVISYTSTGAFTAQEGYVRRSMSGVAPAGAVGGRPWFEFNSSGSGLQWQYGAIHFDGVMFINSLVLDAYYDGDSTDDATYTYEWEGTPHNSRSIRTNLSGPYTKIDEYLFGIPKHRAALGKASNGDLLIGWTAASPNDTSWIRRVDPATMTFISQLEVGAGGDSLIADWSSVDQLEGDWGAGNERYVASTEGGSLRVFDTTTGARDAAKEWTLGTDIVRALWWDTVESRWISISHEGWIARYTDNPGGEYRVAYTWYDGDISEGSSTHETASSPVESMTYSGRSKFLVTTPPAPHAENTSPTFRDKANQIRIYAAIAEAPQLQSTLAIGTRSLTLDDLATGGLPPATNEFLLAISDPGVIESAAADTDGALIALRGDGSGRVGPYKWNTSGAPAESVNTFDHVSHFTSTGSGVFYPTGLAQGVFQAPLSGRVMIISSCFLRPGSDGMSAWIAPEVREGGTVRSGTIVLGISSANGYGNYNLNFTRGETTVIVDGMTPGADYNVYLGVSCGGSNVLVQSSRIRVIPW